MGVFSASLPYEIFSRLSLLGGIEILCPIFRYPSLYFSKVHVSGLDLPSQKIFDDIFLLEIAFTKLNARWSALWPNVFQRVGATQFERYQMIEFASLRRSRVIFRVRDMVPSVRSGFLARACCVVADALRSKRWITQDRCGQGWINRARRAIGIGDWEAVFRSRGT